MKLKNILMTAAVALVGVASANAASPTYAVGDLILGVYDSSSPTANGFYIDLGTAASYVTLKGSSSNFTFGTNIKNDLDTVFGAGNWTSNANLRWAIAGWASVGGTDLNKTSYVSQVETTLGTQSSSYSSGGNNTVRGFLKTDINAVYSAYGAATAYSDNGAAIANSNAASLYSYTTLGTTLGDNTYVTGAFTPGSVALDLYKQYTTTVNYEGTFGVTTGGSVLYVANPSTTFMAVPEPSTYAMMGLGGLGLLGMLRRRSALKA